MVSACCSTKAPGVNVECDLIPAQRYAVNDGVLDVPFANESNYSPFFIDDGRATTPAEIIVTRMFDGQSKREQIVALPHE